MGMDNEKKTTCIYLRCTEDLKRELLKIAKSNERTLSSQCVYFLKKSIEQNRSESG